MSNEEIVARIRAGEQNLMGELWEQVCGLVKWKVNHVMTALQDCPGSGVEYDDLYQSGYLAMVTAVDTYKQNSCAFSTWLVYYLKTAFSELTGCRTQRSKNDPLRNAVSLSSPIGDDEDSSELVDFVPDPNGKKAMENVEERIWYEQLYEAMETALNEIPEEQSCILRHRYYTGKTLIATGREMGLSAEEVRKLEQKGLRALRQPKIAKKIRPFYDFDYYAGAGLQTFERTGTSIQERYLIRQEEEEEQRDFGGNNVY